MSVMILLISCQKEKIWCIWTATNSKVRSDFIFIEEEGQQQEDGK